MARERKLLNEKEKAEILRALREGYPMATAVDLAGVPMALVLRHAQRHSAFDGELRRARGEGQRRWIDRLVQFAEDGKNTCVTDALKLFYPKDWPLADEQTEAETAAAVQVTFEGVRPGEV